MSNEKTPNLTPMVKQYQEIKSRHRDKILLFRVGDFYEMFFEDAVVASEILKITLTSRNDMPLAGFPFHAANQYIYKLITAGRKVAICEQVEDPAKAKGLVRREIVSIVTPSTVLEEGFAVKNENNYLCSLYADQAGLALTMIDIATGDCFVIPRDWFSDTTSRQRLLNDEIGKYMPSEIIYNESLKDLSDTADIQTEIGNLSGICEYYPDWYFDENNSVLRSSDLENIPNISEDIHLKRSIIGAFHYLSDTQCQNGSQMSHDFRLALETLLRNVRVLKRKTFVEMDDFTVRNLELLRNMQDGSRKNTLLSTLDETITSMGGRLLRQYITMPLYDMDTIQLRQNSVEAFFEDSIMTDKTRDILRQVGDLERLLSRLMLGKLIPRELNTLAKSLKASLYLKKLLKDKESLSRLTECIEDLSELTDLIESAINNEPSSTFNGDVIREGYHRELDSLKKLASESKEIIIRMQAQERQNTGINSLKIKYNNIFGYFIEVSKANMDSVPSHYIRKQSLVNAERYTIPELSEYEAQIATATEKLSKLEEEIYLSIVNQAKLYLVAIQKIAQSVSALDVFSTLAVVASRNRYVKPLLSEEFDWQIIEGRHPVVEKTIGHNLFVSNDTLLDEETNRILIITGPNMAGKSTYLRQNALLAVMAQIGSYVPAKSAKMGLVDKIFTRIGASDNLSAGQSTFLVEMNEAANILINATSKSLIIMDELGRGTSTYDGLSIAWAVIEYLYEHPKICGKTLFATHYHELTALSENKGIQNYNIAVREYRDELVFLRKVVAGPADKSYGIYVAKLAGIPNEIIERAKIILETLENEGNIAKNRIESVFDRNYRKKTRKVSLELELFPSTDNIIERIRALNLDTMTPIEALTFLSELKRGL